MPGSNVNLLSLDGGGVRGLSSLLILDKLMKMINRRTPPKPCEVFDMIAGTSTGGIIAIMLGRLHMSVDECIRHYETLMDRVFSRIHKHMLKPNFKTRSVETQSQFDTRALEMAIKEVVTKATGDVNELMMEDNPQCKTFVCVTDCQTSVPMRFLNFERKRGSDRLSDTLTIWEVARATSAASTFFDEITIGPYNQKFRDGGTGANNPIDYLWREALDEWQSLAERANCVLSIGTGKPSAKEFREDSLRELFKTMVAMSTDSEKIEKSFAGNHPELTQLQDRKYFRLNVGEGLGDIGLEDTSKARNIASVTDAFFEDHQEWEKARQIKTLLSPKSTQTQFRMGDESIGQKFESMSLHDRPLIPSQVVSHHLNSASESRSSAATFQNGNSMRFPSINDQEELRVTRSPEPSSEIIASLKSDLIACKNHKDIMSSLLFRLSPEDQRQAQTVLFSERLRLGDWANSKSLSTRLIQGNKTLFTHSPMSFIWLVLLNVYSTNPSVKILSFACGIISQSPGTQGPVSLLRALNAQLLEIPTASLDFTAQFDKPYDSDIVHLRRLLNGLLCQCLTFDIILLIDGLSSYEWNTWKIDLEAIIADMYRTARQRQECGAKPIKFLFTSSGPCETLRSVVKEEDIIYAAGVGSPVRLLERRVVEEKLAKMLQRNSEVE